MPLGTHSQAVSIRHPEGDALSDPSHSENNSKTSASLSVMCSLQYVAVLLRASLQLCVSVHFKQRQSFADSLARLVFKNICKIKVNIICFLVIQSFFAHNSADDDNCINRGFVFSQ